MGALRMGVGPVAFLATYKTFAWFEDIAAPPAKKAIAGWIKQVEMTGSLAKWPGQVAALFDRTFGTRHLSWRCFYRSCLASTLSVLTLLFLWLALHPAGFQTLHFKSEIEPTYLPLFGIITIFVFIVLLMISWLPDYFSLLESRFVIKLMSRTHICVPMRAAVGRYCSFDSDFLFYIVLFRKYYRTTRCCLFRRTSRSCQVDRDCQCKFERARHGTCCL